MDPAIVREQIAAIERKDLSTAAHTWRVVLYTKALAEAHGVDFDLIDVLTQGAAVHDIGKLVVPNAVLQKPGRLDDEEFSLVKVHPTSGHAMLQVLGVSDEPILNLVRHHHERWSGGGYPDGLAGEEIPLAARFFAVIDTFDALTSLRPYRSEVGEAAGDRAIEIIEAESGSHFWPDAVGAFVELYRRGGLGYILHHFNDSCPIPEFTACTKTIEKVRRSHDRD